MANVTLQSALVVNGPVIADYPGLNVRAAQISWSRDFGGASVSVSVVAQMVPVPHGARILDVFARIFTGNAQGGFVVGDGSLSNRFITGPVSITATPAVVARLNTAGGAGFRYSISETSGLNPMYETIDLIFSGAVTSTLSMLFDMTVYYLMDRENNG